MLAGLLLAFLSCLPLAVLASGGTGRAWRLGLATGLAAAAAAAVRRDFLRAGPAAVKRLAWDAHGRFQVELGAGDIEVVRLGQGSLVAGRFLFLVLEGRRRHPVFIDRQAVGATAAAALLRSLHQAGRSSPE